jgi:hypothetical protein
MPGDRCTIRRAEPSELEPHAFIANERASLLSQYRPIANLVVLAAKE